MGFYFTLRFPSAAFSITSSRAFLGLEAAAADPSG
jgi:hypothetical protein